MSDLFQCRICLNKYSELTAIQLLQSSEMQLLLQYLNIGVTESLPNGLCGDCVKQLEDIIAFKNKCLLAASVLKGETLQNLENDYEDFSTLENCSNIGDSGDTFKLRTEQMLILEVNDSVSKVITNEVSSRLESKQFHKTNKSYCCKICRKYFKTDNTLIKHTSKAHNVEEETTFPCQSCSKIFSSEINLEDHRLKSHETTCNICKKRFYSNTNLRKHKLLHENDRPKFFCEKCKKFYGTKEIFDRHNKIFHGVTPQTKTVCTVCGVSVFHIKIHMFNTHSQVKLNCNQCDKILKNRVSLKKHIARVHKNNDLESNKSLCSSCGKVCRTKDDLIIHIKSKHSDERNYKCQYCEKCFKTNSHWRVHEKIVHMKQRPFKCEQCLKTFTTRRHLINHIRTHTGEKPYACNICLRAFSQKGTLDTHTKLVHRSTKIVSQNL